MSDLGRLFRLRGTPDLEPLENFTTTALAIAIGHDDRPMRKALQAVDWIYEKKEKRPALTVLDLGSGIEQVTSETQVRLPPDDGPPGYLDLVLYLTRPQSRKSTIWVEVKVDSWEHGPQLENYRTHAAQRPEPPAIVTLGRTRISPYFPSLRWRDVASAIDSVNAPHHAWLSLRDFFLHEKIVRPPVPADVDVNAGIDIIVEVNRLVRERWHRLAWAADGTLRSTLVKSAKDSNDLSATGGPLRYGLMPGPEGWEWGVVFTTGRNFYKIRLDPEQTLQDAESGGLPQHWHRFKDRLDVLERRLPRGSTTSHDEIVRWFDEGFRELSDAQMLDRYFAALDAKGGTAVVPSKATTSDHAETATLLDAVEFAALKHRDQRRKDADASPYVNHPIGVAHLIAEVGGVTDLNALVAAVLHDTIEDTETTVDELDRRFGSQVRRIVEELTDDKTLEKSVRKELQVEHARSLSASAKLVKIADKIMNVRDVTDSPPADWGLARRVDYFDWAERVVVGCRGVNPHLEGVFDRELTRGRATLATR